MDWSSATGSAHFRLKTNTNVRVLSLNTKQDVYASIDSRIIPGLCHILRPSRGARLNTLRGYTQLYKGRTYR